jgi:hypothetical protein
MLMPVCPRRTALRYRLSVAAARLDHCVIAVSDWDAATRLYGQVTGASVVPIDSGRLLPGR